MNLLNKIKLGFSLCGSFCTFSKVLKVMEECKNIGYDILPIMSFNAYSTDTRFGKADDFIWQIEDICGKKIIRDIKGAEPVGPKNLTDIMLVAPCTGNTLAKLANSIVDTPVTMAVKSHLRNGNPTVVAVSTNDALGGSAKNIGALMNMKNYYFVPMKQDNPFEKPTSVVADFEAIPKTLEEALKGKQLQPVYI